MITDANILTVLERLAGEHAALARLARTQANMPVPMTNAERNELREVRHMLQTLIRQFSLKVPVTSQEECPAQNGDQCCGAPDICRAVMNKRGKR